ncbi:MAG: hypothetical protein P1P78_05215 [Methyloprofundus sp.]|nr:hypothetical protein [Methyloprofundus sp.]
MPESTINSKFHRLNEKGPEETTVKNNSTLNLNAQDELFQLRKENKQLRIERENTAQLS